MFALLHNVQLFFCVLRRFEPTLLTSLWAEKVYPKWVRQGIVLNSLLLNLRLCFCFLWPYGVYSMSTEHNLNKLSRLKRDIEVQSVD